MFDPSEFLGHEDVASAPLVDNAGARTRVVPVRSDVNAISSLQKVSKAEAVGWILSPFWIPGCVTPASAMPGAKAYARIASRSAFSSA